MTAFSEVDGSPQVDVTIEGVTVVRQFKIAWGQRKSFMQDLLGVKDHDYPEALCNHVKCKRFPGKVMSSGADYCYYEYALVDAEYSSNTFVSIAEELAPSAEFLTLDATNFKWGSALGADLEPSEAPGKLDMTLDYTVSWKNLTVLNPNLLIAGGHVNVADVNPSITINSRLMDIVFEAQTLLMHPPAVTRSWDFVEQVATYDMTVRFTYRPNFYGGVAKGWNWIWRADSGCYEQIWSTKTSAAIKIYETMDFSGSLWN